jgi:hypothetical protein
MRRSVLSLFPSSHYALVALLFFFGLELIYGFHRAIPVFVIGLFAVIVLGVVIVRAEEGQGFHPTQYILPIFAVAGLLGYSLFLTTNLWLHAFFVIAAVFLFLLLKHGARQAYPTWNWVLSHIVLFLTLAVIFGWRYHLYTPVLAVLALSLLSIFFISLQSLQRVAPLFLDAVLLALAISFVLTQITWLLLFLPLHFIVQAGIILILYYILFHLISQAYEKGFKRRDVVEYLLVGACALFLILITAQWF